MPRRKPMGRPPKDQTRTRQVKILLTEDEHKAYSAAAVAAQRTLSDWIRVRLSFDAICRSTNAMPSLQFKRRFVPSILSGEKTQTLRPRVRGDFSPGRTLSLLNGYHARSLIGRATIIDAMPVQLADLTDEQARIDGFASRTALVNAINEAYPGVNEFIAVRWRDFIPAR